MSNQSRPVADVARHQPVSMGLAARFVGILLSPRDTFAGVVAEPRWFGMLALTVFIAVACASGFLSTEVGRQALLDAQVSRMESFGMQVTDQLYEQMERRLSFAQYATVIGTVVSVPLMNLVAAGILFAVFSAVAGGEASFRQVFAVVTHVGPIAAVQRVFVAPMNYVRESMDNATNLALFLPMLDEGSFVARMLGAIDLFIVWQVVVIAIGLSVLYRRAVRPIATSLLALYGLIAVAVAAIMSVLGGS